MNAKNIELNLTRKHKYSIEPLILNLKTKKSKRVDQNPNRYTETPKPTISYKTICWRNGERKVITN